MSQDKDKILVIDNDGSFVGALKRVFAREGLDRTFELKGIVPLGVDMADECVLQVGEVIAGSGSIAAVFLDIVFGEPAASDRTGQAIARRIRSALQAPIIAVTSYTRTHSIIVDVSFDQNFDGIIPKELLVGKGFSATFLYDVLEKGRSRRAASRVAELEMDLQTKDYRSGVTLASGGTLRDAEQSLLAQSQVCRRSSDSVAARDRFKFAGDPVTVYQVSEIGEEVMLDLLSDIFSEGSGVVSAFHSGFSGALLFEIKVMIQRIGESQSGERSWILKMAKDSDKIQTELTRHAALKKRGVSKEAYPALYSEEIFSREGWFCIVLEKEEDSDTLFSIIQMMPELERVDQLLHSLQAFLAELYGERLKRSSTLWSDYYPLSNRDVAMVVRLIDQERNTFTRLAGESFRSSLRRVQAFVVSPTSETRIAGFARNIDTRLIHGDLHSRNILIGRGGNHVTTIDFARSDQGPAIYDLAKLEVDLLFSVLDSKDGFDTEWSNFNDWQSLLALIRPGAIVTEEVDESGVSGREERYFWAAIRMLRLIVVQVSEGTTAEEYLMALLWNCLKVISYRDFSLPKKALAILFAERILDVVSAE